MGQWLRVCGAYDEAMQRELESRVQGKIAQGEFASKDIEYIAALKRPVLSSTATLDDELLERLRRCCQTWDLEIKPSQISSHRPVIGKFIVAAKRMLFPIVKVLLKDTIRKQRDFNAAAISLLSVMAARQSSERGGDGRR